MAGTRVGLQYCYGRDVYLWNPATLQYKQLPRHNINTNRYGRVALGFGYDHKYGKFKVLAISQQRRSGLRRFEAFVYTLGTSSWRSIGEVQYPLWMSKPQDSRPKVFGGCPHWIVGSLKCVVSFSVGNEKFNEIPMPFLDNDEAEVLDFALGDRLSIFSYVFNQKRYELWVRLDDGLENTWTKQLSLNELDIHGYRYGYRDMELYGGPELLDPVINIIKTKYPHCKLNDFHVYSYIETIAMIEE
ncbi:uncharacterized protein LOC122639767 [Telopea speciosissima]|uniref:uncharacterized protein LOC122639767 n=1 Tax=Telopea speciosissima TaxID=54955 RepID=UPI001CC6F844|nr:uncharacterized protein LOC122639767 [Telopea speciosissima]